MWFWAWLLLAGLLAGLELFDRQLYTLPWAFGAAAAALLEGLHAPLAWEWVAFVGGSSVLLVAIQRRRRRTSPPSAGGFEQTRFARSSSRRRRRRGRGRVRR
jgi:membrane protein implicated in regulation of membrane protease activity